MDSGSLFGFSCECDNGWKRTPFDNETNFEFLPCIIPNCKLSLSLSLSNPTILSLSFVLSISIACYWIYCGEGTCTKNSTYSHTCQCDSGSYNLLSIPVFPCYSNCKTSKL
ncbi:hypothetical protein RHGRI_014695 [Rhododendron griersonianum]|uniref:EGF-like domain-containing protein n=1 Tax=Rhododendron griersonianum TaxID=479676 RepID=A0AAV6KAE4_9ERIC|nr:hypothetical protein RHGRI_014695 [Rhododendron griersonianum]